MLKRRRIDEAAACRAYDAGALNAALAARFGVSDETIRMRHKLVEVEVEPIAISTTEGPKK